MACSSVNHQVCNYSAAHYSLYLYVLRLRCCFIFCSSGMCRGNRILSAMDLRCKILNALFTHLCRRLYLWNWITSNDWNMLEEATISCHVIREAHMWPSRSKIPSRYFGQIAVNIVPLWLAYLVVWGLCQAEYFHLQYAISLPFSLATFSQLHRMGKKLLRFIAHSITTTKGSLGGTKPIVRWRNMKNPQLEETNKLE